MSTNTGNTVLVRLSELRLNDFDWNGSGGLPLRSDVADTVADFYQNLGVFYLPEPHVMMNDDGTIEVAYGHGDGRRELLLTFKCEGVITYVQLFEDGETAVEGTVRFDPLEDGVNGANDTLAELFFWVSVE